MNPAWPTLLHFEDDLADKELVQHACAATKLKWNIEWVEDGQAAIDYLSGFGCFGNRELFPLPRLILLDLKMPRKSGFEVLEWVRRECEFKWLPVVVFTASNAPKDAKRCFELGANSLIVKPTAFGDLQTYVKELHHYWFELNRLPEP